MTKSLSGEFPLSREGTPGLTTYSERMVFPLWKSLHSLNLMLPKEERKALLLRLFNDDTPLLNLTQKQKDSKKEPVELKVEEPQSTLLERNSSSPEAMVPETTNTGEDPDLEDGGVALEPEDEDHVTE